MFHPVNPKISFPKMEEAILSYWQQHKIFERSVKERTEKEYTFYDGPPFATGLPHYGHILPGTIKDVIPRYWTMKGYRVSRRWGWDCHGLPVENVKEKELGISGKKDIEKMGIADFNESCRSIVQRYVEDWKRIIERTGRWVDMDNDYKTMDTSYMESIWWVFRQLWDKGLIYEGEKVVPYCYRCATPLSNFEATQGYQDKQDQTLTVKFKVKDQENTYFLAWTTTPWTLPSNLALAVNPEIDYVKIKDANGEQYILAQSRVGAFYKNETDYELLETMKGKDLANMKYEPLFPYFADKTDAFFVITANFVTTEDGTGIVHIAPAYGEDDNNACKEHNIGIVNPVDEVGCFTKEVTDFVGKNVHEANKEIIQFLKDQKKIIAIATVNHSYPFCWRCDTPLIYKVIPTWFVNVQKIKKDMLNNNDATSWMPENIKHGRFGLWLENARDWAISRNRYWGSALPMWKCQECGTFEVMGGLEDLYKKVPERMTKLILVRHGESEKNIKKIEWSKDERYPLTEEGVSAIKKVVNDINFADVLYVSPVLRAQQSADILAQKLGISSITEESLREANKGKWEGESVSDVDKQEKKAYFQLPLSDRMAYKRGGGESMLDVEQRAITFIEKKLLEQKGKTVVIVSHESVLKLIEKYLKQWSWGKLYASLGKSPSENQITTVYVDTTTGREFDLHKHIIDEITFSCSACKGTMKRIPEVLDCWFESGSMPYAQVHYPFENKEWFEKNFPAHFIAEGQDQTRGWFYTLMILSTALFNKPAFQNVVVNGIVLAEDGKKMSKKLKNYPDPVHLINQYGADAMRFYLMASPAVQAQDLRFSEKGVEEIVKSILLPFWNAYTFFVTYANIDQFSADSEKIKTFKPSHNLDRWMLSELQSAIETMTDRLEHYDLAGATYPITNLLDNLTNWYIRRSRRRFWKSENDTDKIDAYTTLYIVLTTTAKLLAPYTPFIAEEVYRNLTNEDSVHLTSWPEVNKEWQDNQLNEEGALVRNIVTLGLSSRAKNKIKVRQPLSLIEIVVPTQYRNMVETYRDVIMEELNVKEMTFLDNSDTIAKKIAKPIGALIGKKFGADTQVIIKNAKEGRFRVEGQELKSESQEDTIIVFDEEGKEWKLLSNEVEIVYEGKEGFDVESNRGVVVSLNIHVTEELRLEGIARDIIRTIQDMRKEANYNVADRILVDIQGCDPIVLEKFGNYIKEETLATDIQTLKEHDISRTLDLEDLHIIITLRKV